MSGFKDHFSDRAARYAAFRPVYPPSLAGYLAGIAPARGRAWDAGCGSGQLSVLLGDVFDEVVATDASAQQVANATPHPRVRYRAAPAEASGLVAGSIDLAVAAQAVHWFDQPAYWAEIRRVARPGAAVALVTYGLMEIAPALDRLVEDFYRDVLGAYWPPERRQVEDGYRSIPFPFAPLPPPPDLAIEADWGFPALAGYVGTWSAVRALENAEGPARFTAFLDQLAAAWGDPEAERRIRWPLALRVGRVS